MRFVMLCKNCPQCKTVGVGYISTRSWCKLSKPDAAGRYLGLEPWRSKPHPKCPLMARLKENYKE